MPELIEWPCDVPGCQNFVCEQGAICYMCFEVRCDEHDKSPLHACREPQTNAERQQRKNNTKKRYLGILLSKVEEYKHEIIKDAERHGLGQCELVLPTDTEEFFESSRASGFNIHFPLNWQDGTKWLLRVRQDLGHRLPRQVRELSIRSEVTTLSILQDNGIPVPAAWLPAYIGTDEEDPHSEPPFDYFFYEFLEGKTWTIPKHPWYAMDLPQDTLSHFIEGYAKHQIQMSLIQLPVKQIGCLQPSKLTETVEAGPIIARGTFQNSKPPYLLGPFSTQRDRYLAHIDATLRYIILGAVSRYDCLDAYLWHLELRELVSHSDVLAQPIEEVHIKHDDEKGDHLMWDEEGNIVGILDWEWAYTTTKGEAFAAPYIFYEDIDYITADNIMTKEEQLLIDCYERHSRPDLADCVRGGRLYQRLRHIGQYADHNWKRGFREPFGPNPAPNFHPPKYDVDWRVYMMKRYTDDVGLADIMQRSRCTIEKSEEEARKWHQEKE
ncbi:uncharacterized protein IL334_002915 [Kwoniella shivajii]|uniref:Aminoglycoside phosphotransferase domain-containing protein n=1 Tax=Kwoniella shivajii TaxID=564305 RepID=A0ABZ1CW28_9TREE|nr:hypothetical protein IL334_002915 [Kwoniella shivajii]